MSDFEEEEFESLPPPIYTLEVDFGESLTPLDSSQLHVMSSSRHRGRPVSAPVPNLQRTLPPTPCHPASIATRYVYYHIFGPQSKLPSRNSFDPSDDTIGRVPARNIAPPRTARLIRQYIAHFEGLDPSHIAALYIDADSDGDAIPDDAKVGVMVDGGPGTTADLPLAIILNDTYPRLPEDTSHTPPRTPVSPQTTTIGIPIRQRSGSTSMMIEVSPRLVPGGLPLTPTTPPQHITHLPLSTPSAPASPNGVLRRSSTASSLPILGAGITVTPAPRAKWIVDEHGFGEPVMSDTEADKVRSSKQPPGWLMGRIQTIGKTVFMSKGKNMNVTRSGTVLQNGMRVWVDARSMKQLKLATGDVYRTYRVILQSTREVTCLWTGDISIEQEDLPSNRSHRSQ